MTPSALFAAILLSFLPLPLHGEGGSPFFEKRVFLHGREGAGAYAIPKAVVASAGTVIVVCQDRSGGDWAAPIDAVWVRSTDGGRTWSRPRSLVPEEEARRDRFIWKPTGIVTDRKTGKVLVFLSRAPLRNRRGGPGPSRRSRYASVEEVLRKRGPVGVIPKHHPLFPRLRSETVGESIDSARISRRRDRAKEPAGADLTFLTML